MNTFRPEFDPLSESTHAQYALAFALTDYEPTMGDTTGASVELLQKTVAELQKLPPHSSLTWSQGYWRQIPGAHVTGSLSKDFADASAVRISINEAVAPPRKPDSFMRDDALTLSFLTFHPTDDSRTARISYRVERDGKEILCEVDKAFGVDIQSAFDLISKVEETSTLSGGGLEEMLGGLLLEGTIMAEGLSPDLDTEIEELREDNEAYRVLSDEVRHQNAGLQLEEQLGIEREHALSFEQTQQLVAYLKSL